MKKMKFYKAQTNGNDFIIVTENDLTLLPSKIQELADRKYGIGCDQVIFLRKNSEQYCVEFYNKDGSRANMCGNGACAVGLLISRVYGIDNVELSVSAELVTYSANCLTRHNASKCSASVYVRQFAEYFSCQGLGMSREQASSAACLDRSGGRDVVKLQGYHIAPPKNCVYNVRCSGDKVTIEFPLPERHGNFVYTGNRHLVLPKSEIRKVHEIARENPDCNIHFVSKIAEHTIRVKTFERGVGWTLACGSGAIAVGYHSGIKGKIEIIHDGGKSMVEVKSTQIELTTAPKIVYEGEFYE